MTLLQTKTREMLDLVRRTTALAVEIAQESGLAAEAEAMSLHPDIITIQTVVATHYKLFPSVMRDTIKTQEIALARLVAMAICRKLTTLSLGTIARGFYRTHGSIMYAIKAMDNQCATEPRFQAEFSNLLAECGQAVAVRPAA